MLEVRGLTHRFFRNGAPWVLFSDLSFDLPPSGRLGILGRNGQGKSTLIKILGGVLEPSAGSVRWGRDVRCSWPLGLAGGFQGGMTGMDNIRFIARIYGHPIERLVESIDSFAELGDALTMPMKHFSSGMRARLAFGLALAIDFDCYLIDEVIAVGDALFREKCEQELFGERADRAFVIASHDLEMLKETCTRGIVVDGGRAHVFDDIGPAVEAYRALSDDHHPLDEALRHRTAPPQDATVKPLRRDQVKVESGEAQRIEITSDGERLHWPRRVFRSREAADGLCPGVLDVAGPARHLFFGPYLPLTQGKWRATVDLEVDADASHRSLAVEFGVEPEFVRVNLPFGVSGPLRVRDRSNRRIRRPRTGAAVAQAAGAPGASSAFRRNG